MSPARPAKILRLRPGEGTIPRDRDRIEVRAGVRTVRLTSLRRVFFPATGITKRDLLQFYLDVSAVLLPHLKDRPMVMKRYPGGVEGEHFFMKRTPAGTPEWVERCSISHRSGSVIGFPMVQDLPSLLWMVNLGCVDLNPWYSRCDQVDRPDFLHFDLDPVPPAPFSAVRESALLIRDALAGIGARSYAKTSGSRGIHVYVPIVRGPMQKQVWRFAKALAVRLAGQHPELLTAEYRVAERPPGRVLVDFNQNAWGRTLASVYSVRPRAGATVSTPVTWEEVAGGVEITDFTIANLKQRLDRHGDLWRPLLRQRGRFQLEPHL